MILRDWMLNWYPGCWHKYTHLVGEPSLEIPEYLHNRYYVEKIGTMPGGPLVERYDIEASMSQTMTEYGYPGMDVKMAVTWDKDIAGIKYLRSKIFGDNQRQIDLYHSQAAISGHWLLLNEIQRKINKTRDFYSNVTDICTSFNTEWDVVYQNIYKLIEKDLRFDAQYALDYADDHKDSTVIPGAIGYRSKRWPSLTIEELEYIFFLVDGFVTELNDNFEEMRYLSNGSSSVGRGIRGRSEEISGIEDNYDLFYTRSRQVAFNPVLSPWNAYMSTESKNDHYAYMAKESEDLLGVKVILPPLVKGSLWSIILDYIQEGYQIINSDGSNWETWSATILKMYIQSVYDGIYQYMSGTANTSRDGTFAMLKLISTIIPTASGSVEAVVSMGDDLLVLGKNLSIRDWHVPGILEMDKVATDNHIILGMKIWVDQNGGYCSTFPGLYRITVDRADKRINLKPGEQMTDITRSIDTASLKAYKEIMSYGTINGIAAADYIKSEDNELFWDQWMKNRYQLIAGVLNEGA